MTDVPRSSRPHRLHPAAGPRPGGVRSIEHAFAPLEIVAGNGGAMGLSDLPAASGLPLTRLHRVARTLVDLGYLRQEAFRQYALGHRLFLLTGGSSAKLTAIALPHLSHLVDVIGETANLATLDGDQVVYVPHAPGRHSMRMFTEVGRRVHRTAPRWAKALLASSSSDEVRALLTRTGLPRRTPHTVTDPAAFLLGPERVRARGFAVDDGEQELGVRCVAVVVPKSSRGSPCPSPARPPGCPTSSSSTRSRSCRRRHWGSARSWPDVA